jgi:SAM-dependent methyltransferase
MHDTARAFGRMFFDSYCSAEGEATILDIGAMNVNGSLRDEAPLGLRYIGVDMEPGPGVDVVVDDPGVLPFAPASVDVVVSSSCFEHAEHFWELFGEVQRVLKPGGLFYVNAPSNGLYHRYPVDCWRFYPDAGLALERWGRKLGHATLLLESFVASNDGDVWNDFVAVFLKDQAHELQHPRRIADKARGLTNVWRRDGGTLALRREIALPEDLRRLRRCQSEVERLSSELAVARARLRQLEGNAEGPEPSA